MRYLRRGRRPASSEAAIAQRLLDFLEHRRIVWAPRAHDDTGDLLSATADSESPVFAVDAVLKIRKRLTADLEGLAAQSPLAESIRAMQLSCRAFLDAVHQQAVER